MVKVKTSKAKKIAIVAVVFALVVMIPFLLSVGANAAGHPVLTESVDLRTKVTISTEGGVSVLTDYKGNKYELKQSSVLYSGGGVLQVYLNNTAPVTINAVVCKGNFQVMGGSGTLNVVSTKAVAIDVGYFDVHESATAMTINANGQEIGIRSKYFVEVAKGTVNGRGSQYGCMLPAIA